MKLVFCDKCQDLFRLTKRTRRCTCKNSGGKYRKDGLHAEVFGDAIPLGIHNRYFLEALRARPKTGMGNDFNAWVIAEECPTITVVEDPKLAK
jgi:hypothetical protein